MKGEISRHGLCNKINIWYIPGSVYWFVVPGNKVCDRLKVFADYKVAYRYGVCLATREVRRKCEQHFSINVNDQTIVTFPAIRTVEE